jgi:glycosyltransferase involved in cell wall biosynthesis
MTTQRPIRVLYLVKTASGARWSRHIEQYSRLGVEAHVVSPPGPLAAEFARFGTHYEYQVDFPKRRPTTFPKIARNLRRIVAEVKPDLIHSSFVGTTISARLALGRNHPIPRVFHVAGPLHLEHRLPRLLEIKTAGKNDYWMAGCRAIREMYLAAGVAPHRVGIGYFGSDSTEIPMPVAGRLRAELGLEEEMPLVGMVAFMYPPRRWLGRHRGIKGHEDLIDAVALARRQRPDIRAVFIGGTWTRGESYERRIRARAARRLGDAAIFLGTRSDVPEIYRDLDVAVHPSLSESLGGAAQSLLYEVPTIATTVGGLPELVLHGETGLLVPPRNPEAIASAIGAMLSDRPVAARMAARGRELVLKMLNPEVTHRSMVTAYRRILDSGRVMEETDA